MKISITNRHHRYRVNARRIKTLTRWLMLQVKGQAPDKTWELISVVVMDDEGMATVNQRFLAKPGPTDVISFIYEPLPGQRNEYSGEVVVNIDRAIKEARLRRTSPSKELALYLAHGCQHLGGASDRTARLRARMRRNEQAWLRAADRCHYLGHLITSKQERGP